MPKTFLKLRLHSNKHKPEIEQEPNKSQSILLPNLPSYERDLLSGSSFVEY